MCNIPAPQIDLHNIYIMVWVIVKKTMKIFVGNKSDLLKDLGKKLYLFVHTICNIRFSCETFLSYS